MNRLDESLSTTNETIVIIISTVIVNTKITWNIDIFNIGTVRHKAITEAIYSIGELYTIQVPAIAKHGIIYRVDLWQTDFFNSVIVKERKTIPCSVFLQIIGV